MSGKEMKLVYILQQLAFICKDKNFIPTTAMQNYKFWSLMRWNIPAV